MQRITKTNPKKLSHPEQSDATSLRARLADVHWYGVSNTIREAFKDLALFMLIKTNRYKDRCLAKKLRDLADLYDPE
jgi:hypothetical protein